MKTRGVPPRRRTCAPHGILLIAALLCLGLVARAADDPSRAYRLGLEDLGSVDAIRRSVATAAAAGVEAILAPVSLWPEENPSAADVLDAALQEAVSRKIRVYAWLHVGRAATADEIPGSREHVLYRHPEWLMVPRELALELMQVDLRSPEYIGRLARWTRANLSRADGLYVSPIHPDAIEYLAARVMDVLRRYAVHGVHLDALEFPDNGFDYSRRALDLFRADVRRRLDTAQRARMERVEAIDPFAYPEEFPDEWRQFRQARLTALVAQLRSAIRAVHPALAVTASVTADAEVALRDHLQDWRGWIDGRLIDAVAPAAQPTGAARVASGAP